MAIDKLRYDSQNVSIAREIQKYPKHLGIREAIQNAIEGDGKTGASDIQIISLNVSGLGDFSKLPKFAIWDNGPGMDASALKKLTNMASSTKQMRGTNNPNFGRGEIAATLSYNSFGVFWISCKNNRVNLVWIRKIGEDYGRNTFDYCEINNETVVIDITDTPFFDSLKSQYDNLMTTDKTWTLKVYLGDNDAQNTCTAPFGDKKPTSINWAYNELYKRYHHIPGSNFDIKDGKLIVDNNKVSITFNENTFSDSSNKKAKRREFSTESQDFVKTLGSESLDAEQEVVTDTDTGISFVYNFDGKQTHNTTGKRASWNARWRAVESQSVSIVMHGEMYDRRDGNKFYPFMKNFGVYQGADQFKITIILPEDYDAVYPDSDRQVLKWESVPTYSSGETDEQVTIYDFDQLIRRNMPQWFKDKIDETRKNIKPDEDMQSRLQQYLNSLYAFDKKADTPGKTSGKKGLQSKKPDPAARRQNGKNNGLSGLKPRNNGEAQSNITAPNPVILTEKDFKEHEGGEGKAAIYNVSQNEVLINSDYVSVIRVLNKLMHDNMIDSLPQELAEKVHIKIQSKVINEFSFKIACHVINSFYHKKAGQWEAGEVDGVYLDPAAMSAVADSIEPYLYEGLSKPVKELVTLEKNSYENQIEAEAA